MGSYAQSLMTHWSRGPAKSREKLKPSNLHYQSVYGHQTWQYGNFYWEASTHLKN